MNMEWQCLHQGFEVFPYQSIAVLHHICTSNWRDREPVNISGLETYGKYIALLIGPRGMQVMPEVFDDAEQDCVQNFDGSVLGGIQPLR